MQSGAHWLIHVCKQIRLVLTNSSRLKLSKRGVGGPVEDLLLGVAKGILDWYWLVGTGGDEQGIYTLEH